MIEGLRMRLSAYLRTYQEMSKRSSLPDRLRTCLPQLSHALSVSRAPADVQTRELDQNLFLEIVGELKQRISIARSSGTGFNVWSAAGLARSEVRNSAALARLWDPRVAGSRATDFLRSFLESLTNLNNTLPNQRMLEAGYSVRIEHCPMGSLADRVDLVIEGDDFLIGIEIKIDAELGKSQLERYCLAISQRAFTMRKSRQAVIYLGCGDSAVPEGVIKSRWSGVAAAARHVAISESYIDHTLTQFATHIENF